MRVLARAQAAPQARWAAPSHQFGEGISRGAGLAMPSPDEPVLQAVAPVAFTSEWASDHAAAEEQERRLRSRGGGGGAGAAGAGGGAGDDVMPVRPGSAMEAAEQHWARMQALPAKVRQQHQSKGLDVGSSHSHSRSHSTSGSFGQRGR